MRDVVRCRGPLPFPLGPVPFGPVPFPRKMLGEWMLPHPEAWQTALHAFYGGRNRTC